MTDRPESSTPSAEASERTLRPRDRRLLLLCALLSAISLAVGVWLYPRANPEASIRFEVDRSQSEANALELLQELGRDTDDHRHAAIFTYDRDAKVFLERTLGLETTNRLLGEDLPLWRWSHRWFRPLEAEEFKVEVAIDGRVVGFEHIVPEIYAGSDLDPTEARPIAEAFLESVAGVPLDGLEFLDTKSEGRPNRTDHTFTWKRTDLELGGASYRYQVTIQGGRPGAFRSFVKVPEAWSLEYRGLRASNETLATIAGAFLAFTFVAMVVVLLRRVRYRDVPWKTALVFGVVGATLAFLANLNGLPLEVYRYDTTSSYPAFLLLRILGGLIEATGLGLLIFVMVAAAEPLYRSAFPEKIALGRLFTPSGFRTRRFLLSTVVGITLTCGFFAFQEIFYIVAARMGAWAPSDVPYTNVVNTAFPWIFVLLVGFIPAVTEEFTSRMFSIPFLQNVLRVRWLAVLLPALIWGFAHANYPNQPPYIRGIEVSVAGIVIGIVMLRVGILAPLIWHFLIDALYFSLLLFRSGNTYYVISAAVACGAILLPFVYAVVSYARRGEFDDPRALRNVDQPGPIEPEEDPRPVPVWQPIPGWSRRRRVTVLVTSVAVAALAAVALPRFDPGTSDSMEVGRTDARRLSDAVVRSLHEEPDSFHVALLGVDAAQAARSRFALESAGAEGLAEMTRRYDSDFRWRARYYRWEDPREILVELSGTGELIRLRRQLAEAQSLPSLDSEAALTVAESYLSERGVDASQFVLRESSTESRPERLDHTFAWEARADDPRNVGEGRHRVRVVVQGDEVGAFSTDFKLPEAWQRDREETTAAFGLRILALVLAGGLFVGLALFALFDGHRRGLTRWGWAALLGLPFILFHMAHRWNEFPALAAGYPTAQPWMLYLISAIAVGGISFVFLYLLYVVGIAAISTMFPQGWALRERAVRRALVPDAVVAAISVLTAAFLIQRLGDAVLLAAPAAAPAPSIGAPAAADTYFPWFSIVAEVFHRWILALAATGSILGVLRLRHRQPVLTGLLVLLGVVALVPLDVRGAAEFTAAFGFRVVQVAVALALARWILRGNLLAYPLSLFLVAGAVGLAPYLSASGGFFRTQGWVALVLLLLPLLWLVLGGTRSSSRAPAASPARADGLFGPRPTSS